MKYYDDTREDTRGLPNCTDRCEHVCVVYARIARVPASAEEHALRAVPGTCGVPVVWSHSVIVYNVYLLTYSTVFHF